MDPGLLTAMVVAPATMALVAGISRAAAAGRIGRNGAVGIRFPSTLVSDAAWREGHRAAVVPACWWLGVLVVADGAAAVLRGRGPADGVLAVAVVLLVLPGIAWIAVAASRAARSA